MITRARVGISKPRHPAYVVDISTPGIFSALFNTNEVKGFNSAAKHSRWLVSIDVEIVALKSIDTWDLVSHPADAHSRIQVSFSHQFWSDGSIEHHKACLVAQGFAQVP